MRIRRLVWEDHRDRDGALNRAFVTNVPQFYYSVRLGWDGVRGVRQYVAEFGHGYINTPQILGHYDTPEDAKFICSTHFNNYVQYNFLET